MEFHKPSRVYVLVRSDLTPAQVAVQTAHALAELFVAYGESMAVREWATRHKTLVVLGVRSEAALHAWKAELLRRRIPCSGFLEPDLGSELTALAVHPCADTGLFRHLQLWRP